MSVSTSRTQLDGWRTIRSPPASASEGAPRLIGAPEFSTKSVRAADNDGISYRCRRVAADRSHDITVPPGQPVEPDPTRTSDRSSAGVHAVSWADDRRGRPAYVWPLREVEQVYLDETLIERAGPPSPASKPMVHYVDGERLPWATAVRDDGSQRSDGRVVARRRCSNALPGSQAL